MRVSNDMDNGRTISTNTEELLIQLDSIGALGAVRPSDSTIENSLTSPDCLSPRQTAATSGRTDGNINLDMSWVFSSEAERVVTTVPEAFVKLAEEVRRQRPNWTAASPRTPSGTPSEGVDAVTGLLVWYQPIHFYAEAWGIRIRTEAVVRTVPELVRSLPWVLSDEEIDGLLGDFIRAAVMSFYFHEEYHHAVESFAIRLEMDEGDGGRYVSYHSTVYRPQLNQDLGPNEEALANAMEFRRSVSEAGSHLPPLVARALVEYLRASIPMQGRGYNRGLSYVGDRSFVSTEAFLKSEVAAGSFHEARRRPSSSWPENPAVAPLLNCRDRVFLVR